MGDLLKSRLLKIIDAESIQKNFKFILFQSGIERNPNEEKIIFLEDYIKKLNEIKIPKEGDIVTWEENDIFGNLVKYAGIIYDERERTVLHKENGEIFLDNIESLTRLYGTRRTRIHYYKV